MKMTPIEYNILLYSLKIRERFFRLTKFTKVSGMKMLSE